MYERPKQESKPRKTMLKNKKDNCQQFKNYS